jgi:hypothetical protein
MRALTLALVAALAAALPARSGENLSAEALLPGHEATEARMPAAAFGKDVYLVVWQTDRNEKADIVALRLDKSGRPMEGKPFVISAAKDAQERPKVTFGGGVFLVVWHDLRNGKDWDVYGTRVTPEGKVLDADGIAIAAAERNQCEADAAWDGKNFQVLWRGFQGDKNLSPGVSKLPNAGYHVYGGRVSAEGQMLDGAGVFMAKPPREYLTPRGLGMAAAIALPNGQVLAGARSGGSLCLWKIADGKPSGEPKAPAGRTGFDDVAFASSGRTVLAVWSTFRDGGGRSSGVGDSGMLLIGADGEAGSAKPASLSSADKTHRGRHPAPVWDGKRYVVAWDAPMRGNKDGFAYEAVFLRAFDADGKPLGDDVPVADEPGSPAWYAAASSDGAGTTLIAYERHPKTGDQPIRIGVRVLTAK